MILTKKMILQLFLFSILSGIFVTARADDEQSYTGIIANNSQQPWTIRFSISSNSGYLDSMSDCSNGFSCTIAPGMRKTVHYIVQSDQFNGTVTITDNKEHSRAFGIYYYYASFPKTWLRAILPSIFFSQNGIFLTSISDKPDKSISFHEGYITINCNDWECSKS
ncbi:MAG: hypothetical protein K0R24_1048 [Gammaproteobacteria bacterium]|jgi:hypothetical protein|nr:hypothetical protein [Gammaproteobacteria bacterium]